MLFATTGAESAGLRAAITADQLMAMQRLVRRIPVSESVVDAILDLVRDSRPSESGVPQVRERLAWGPGPRASQALSLAVRARALIEGRLAPSIDDVVALAGPILRHRMALTFGARADGVTIDGVIDDLLQRFA